MTADLKTRYPFYRIYTTGPFSDRYLVEECTSCGGFGREWCEDATNGFVKSQGWQVCPKCDGRGEIETYDPEEE
jgi:DnaJ-class molecular chaperone